MKIGDKPLADMTKEEMIEAIRLLQDSREALRAEAVKRVAEGKTAKVKTPRAKKEVVVDPSHEEALRILMGGLPKA